jgi:hypothetical protein
MHYNLTFSDDYLHMTIFLKNFLNSGMIWMFLETDLRVPNS